MGKWVEPAAAVRKHFFLPTGLSFHFDPLVSSCRNFHKYTLVLLSAPNVLVKETLPQLLKFLLGKDHLLPFIIIREKSTVADLLPKATWPSDLLAYIHASHIAIMVCVYWAPNANCDICCRLARVLKPWHYTLESSSNKAQKKTRWR